MVTTAAEPPMVLPVPVKVCTPVPEVNVPLSVRLPPKLTALLPELLQVAPLTTVTSPVNVLRPVPARVSVPDVPPPTLVVPPTLRV